MYLSLLGCSVQVLVVMPFKPVRMFLLCISPCIGGVQEKQGLRADMYTYSLLMNGYALARRPDMAFKLVSSQQSRSIQNKCACKASHAISMSDPNCLVLPFYMIADSILA